jgi:ABC-type multidrug transport system ATPase subunit
MLWAGMRPARMAFGPCAGRGPSGLMDAIVVREVDVPAVIEAVELSYAYGGHRAVEDVSFAVAEGEIFGLLGPNGAGKSTTIKMLTGQLTPDGGRLSVLGLEMPADREAVHARMGVCFEEKNLYLQMSASENLVFFAELFGIRRFDPSDLLRRVGLADRAKDRVSGFSKGMRQRLMVARALVNEPDVLFLDEPTDGLDPVSARSVRAIIQDEATKGAAVVLTTHDMMEADQLSDRVAFINDGTILACDSPEKLKLAHGHRTVRVRFADDDQVVFPLDGAGSRSALATALERPDLTTVHTEEATLEDVFVTYAGRGLEG